MRSARPLLFLLFLSLPALLRGQTVVEFRWDSPTSLPDPTVGFRSVPSFAGAVYDPAWPNLPATSFLLSGVVTGAEVGFAVYEPVPAAEASLVPSALISGEVQFRFAPLQERGQWKTHVLLLPFRHSGSGQLERLVSAQVRATSYGSAPGPSSFSLSSTRPYGPRANAALRSARSTAFGGGFYKLGVTESGIYKLDATFFQSIGLSIGSFDPRDLVLWGLPSGMLPQQTDAPRNGSLEVMTIHVEGESDGVFDPTDYVLFHAQSPHAWSFNAADSTWRHEQHLYSDTIYYYLSLAGGGRRVFDRTTGGGAGQTITRYEARTRHELDERNVLNTGREWYGEEFQTQNPRTINFSFPGTVSGTARLRIGVMGQSGTNTSFAISVGGQSAGPLSILPSSIAAFGVKGRDAAATYTFSTSSLSNYNVQLTYQRGGDGGARGFLNYLDWSVPTGLALAGNQTEFRAAICTATANSEYVIENMSAVATIWDVTDPMSARSVPFSLIGSEARFTVPTDSLREFVVFQGTNFPSPQYFGQASFQDLRGTPLAPNLLIISPGEFFSEANRLALHHQNFDGMTAMVVSPQQIYNEFSSGRQDITALRDFIRFLYQMSAGSDSLRYVLMLGDCSFDFKQRLSPNTNFVPSYQSYESLHNINSYVSDDFFGFLDDGEGVWQEGSSPVNHGLDVGVGRLPAKSLFEARAMVDKIIRYASNPAGLGPWRTKLNFVADDADADIHFTHAESLNSQVQSLSPALLRSKIYVDAFPQIGSPGALDQRAPLVNEAINVAVENGTLMLNYTGHGNPFVWSSEQVLTINQLNDWDNPLALPVVVTATCTFGQHDLPFNTSGSEDLLLRSDGGAIAALTTSRPVFASTNLIINQAYYDISVQLADTLRPRLGDIMRYTKNNGLAGVNNRNFILLGDPALALNLPTKNIAITSFNSSPRQSPDTLQKLGTVALGGEVRYLNGGNRITGFSGTLHATVFGPPTTGQTLGDETPSSTPTFTQEENVLFKGEATITSGQFSLSFVVPQDTATGYSNARVRLYAEPLTGLEDGMGLDASFLVGGLDGSAATDNQAPQIQLYLEDETFVSGGATGRSPLLIATFEDEHGIYTASSLPDQGILATLYYPPGVSNVTERQVVLSTYYTANKDNFQMGRLNFPFEDLPPGRYTLELGASDTYLNRATQQIEFQVIEEGDLQISHVLNYPNPFSTRTEFHFDHNRAGDDLEVMVEIYTISGKLIETLIAEVPSASAHVNALVWNGRDGFGDRIGRGIYVYRLTVRSKRDGAKTSKLQKIALL